MSIGRRIAVARSLLIVVALACAAACAQKPASLDDDPELAVLPIGGDFELTGDDGKPVTLARFRGQVVLLFFGYTACPDVCPTTLARLSRAYALLAERGVARAQVATLFVTVDPARDTPQTLAKYLGYFGVDAIGATGTEAEILAIAKSYGATFWREETPGSVAGYLMSHTTSVFLIDRLGKVRHVIAHEDRPEAIADLVEKVVRADCCSGPERPRRTR